MRKFPASRVFLVTQMCLLYYSTVPISYVHGLEYFVNVKSTRLPLHIAEPQLKYVTSLKEQLKAPSSSTVDKLPASCLVNAPVSASYPPARQGPFLLQPAPKELGDGVASDIVYLEIEVQEEAASKGKQNANIDGGATSMSVVLIAYGDGKVDVCLDVEKVEAKWAKANSVVRCFYCC